MALAGSQKIWGQDSAPVQRCGPKGRTGPRGRGGGNGDGDRYGAWDGNEDRNEGGDGNGDGDGEWDGEGDKKGREDGGEREPGSLRSDSRSGAEDTTERATPAINQQPHPQGTTHQQDRRNIWRTGSQGREARDKLVEGGGEAKKRKEPQKNKSCKDEMWKTGETWAVGEKNVHRRQESVQEIFLLLWRCRFSRVLCTMCITPYIIYHTLYHALYHILYHILYHTLYNT